MTAILSAHFTWQEVTRSPTATRLGINNSLPPELVPNVERTVSLMERIRLLIGGPIKVNSWYRCLALNTAVGGSKTSAHPKGLAVDWEPTLITLAAAFHLVAESGLIFDQLIHEGTRDGADWIHVGLSEGQPRRQVMLATGAVLGGAMSFTRVAAG
jgi:zinc D-Ala-D-Ala carboxypeptidase